MIKKLGTGLLSIFIATSSATEAAADEGYEFQKKLERGFGEVYIPIDCDKLGEADEITPEFVKQMGIWGHLENIERRLGPDATDDEKISAFKEDLRRHGVDDAIIEETAEICRVNFP